MALSTSTLRPGLLVSLTTSIKGNIQYRTRDLEAQHITEGGALRSLWETEKRIEDAAEYERATKAKSKVRSLIVGACAYSAFGLLCPEDGVANLEARVAEAEKVVREFNATARVTRLSFYTISGRIAQDDARAVRAINSEIEGLMDIMARGIERLDVKAVREAANKAKSVGTMLNPQMQARIQTAVDAARQAARRITKAGEEAAQEIDKATIRKIEAARVAFLDLDEAKEVQAPEFAGRAVDLLPEDLDAEFGKPEEVFEGSPDWSLTGPVPAQLELD